MLLDQKGSLTDYPYPSAVQLEPGETLERYRARVIHTLGNLTLLTQKLNSSVSNGPFSDKAKAIRADSDSRLNARLREGDVPLWSEAEILKRGEQLFSTAIGVWQCPTNLQKLRQRATADDASDEEADEPAVRQIGGKLQ